MRTFSNQIEYIFHIHSEEKRRKEMTKTAYIVEMHDQIHPFTHQATMMMRVRLRCEQQTLAWNYD